MRRRAAYLGHVFVVTLQKDRAEVFAIDCVGEIVDRIVIEQKPSR